MTHGNIKCMTHFHCLTTSQLPIPGKAPWYRGQWCSLIFRKWSESWDEVLSVPRPNLSVPFQIDSLIEVVQVRNVKQCFPQCFAYLNMYEGAQLASLFHGTNSLAYYSTRFLIGVSLWGTWNTLTHGRRTESIVVMCWQMRSMHLGSSHRCVTDQLSPCCQKKEVWCSLLFRLRWNTSLPVPAANSWPLTGNVLSTVPSSLTCQSPLNPLTHTTTGVNWLWQGTQICNVYL